MIPDKSGQVSWVSSSLGLTSGTFAFLPLHGGLDLNGGLPLVGTRCLPYGRHQRRWISFCLGRNFFSLICPIWTCHLTGKTIPVADQVSSLNVLFRSVEVTSPAGSLPLCPARARASRATPAQHPSPQTCRISPYFVAFRGGASPVTPVFPAIYESRVPPLHA